jgi:sigma-B regulation protein RsbU (phosphoserine phosphatase)
VIGSGFDTAVYGQEAITLSPWDRLILYTDGLTDNFGPDGERDGRDRFYAALRVMAANPVDDLVQTVFEQTRVLRGKTAPTDDMSLVAIEYTG